ncbi:unnamed protein product [Cylindrotheca closterium]|uniref:F-actin-capping protein subunit alpha n=1 Tax=Cylindrotheca closterium TaxID=2856 RepID=A0AAD2G694_9STRA|nr:unnamed protein product [Cylindrotheca closterium]
MSTEAAKTLLRSAAPGQFDVVAEHIHKLARPEGPWLDEATAEQTALTCSNLESNAGGHPLAAGLEKILKEYQEKTFSSKGIAAKFVLQSSDGSDLQIHTYAEKLDLPNFYTGYWKATWILSSDNALSGETKIHTCSYEDGNNHLTMAKTFDPTPVTEEAPKDLPEEEAEDALTSLEQGILNQIIKWEHDVLDSLSTMHEEAPGSLKKIRRVLPITKTKMKWDVVAQRSVKTLMNSTKR